MLMAFYVRVERYTFSYIFTMFYGEVLGNSYSTESRSKNNFSFETDIKLHIGSMCTNLYEDHLDNITYKQNKLILFLLY